MSALKNALVLVLSAACFFYVQGAGAQSTGGRDSERIRILETKVNQLEGYMAHLNQRLSDLEYNQRPPVPPPPPAAQEVMCLITDSGYKQVFMGKGRVRLEAEAAARQACGSGTHPTYCTGAIKCSDPRQDPYVRGAICMITDTGYKKTFKAEGKTVIEAEYAVRKACGSGTHPTYCQHEASCETF